KKGRKRAPHPPLRGTFSSRAGRRRLQRQFAGLNSILRREVTGELTGWKRQRLTADSAARSNTRGGEALTTRADVTVPSVPTVNSTSTSPARRRRWASRGYSGAGRLIGRKVVLATGRCGGGAAGCVAGLDACCEGAAGCCVRAGADCAASRCAAACRS